MIEATFKDEAPEAFLVVTAENGSWDPNVKHYNPPTAKDPDGSWDYGLFQLNEVQAHRVGGDVNKLLDPETNVQVAYQMYKEQGWKPWAVSVNLGLK